MINVSILESHPGYHYELIKYPPKNINYCLDKENLGIDMRALLDNPNDCERNILFCNFMENSGNIFGYFSKPKELIHSHLFPVVNKVPHVIDMGAFYYPYLIDNHEFKLMHELKKPFVSVRDITAKSKARLEKTKIFLRSKFCKKILPWSKWCRDLIMDFIDEPDIVKKIELLYPAVHNANYKRKQHKNVRLLYVSRPEASFERKGGDNMLRAFNILKHDYSNIELTFIGSIPKYVYDKYRKYEKIKFYFSLKKEKLFEVYRRSDIFVLPTRHDSFGFVLLEAMNFSLPIITTKGSLVPVMTEIIDDGVSGFLIEMKDIGASDNIAGSIDFKDFIVKLRLLIENGRLRKEMGQAGKEKIASGEFSLRKRNKRLNEIYEEALQ